MFFKRFYSALFQRQLANKPIPWRRTLLLELLFGGWTLIRRPILERFGKFKDIQFLALMHLLEKNVPLTLSVYSVIFKSNAYEAYHLAMMQIWVIIFYLRTPSLRQITPGLAGPAHILEKNQPPHVWGSHIPPRRGRWISSGTFSWTAARWNKRMGQCRGYQKKGIMAKPIQRQLHNFYTWFRPPPRANYSHRQLRRLKVCVDMFILNTIEQICTHPFAGQEQPRMPRQRRSESRWVLPALYGQTVVKKLFSRLGTSLSATKNCITSLEQISASSLPTRPAKIAKAINSSFLKYCAEQQFRFSSFVKSFRTIKMIKGHDKMTKLTSRDGGMAFLEVLPRRDRKQRRVNLNGKNPVTLVTKAASRTQLSW